MSLALVYSRALSGMNAPLVEVEAHLANGLPHFNIVGLPDTEVKESRDRVRAAIIKVASTSPPKKLPSTSHRPTSPKNPAVSIYRLPWAFLPHRDKLILKSSRNMSLLENWRCPACCVPYAARWPWHGRECRPAVRSSCRKKMPNRLPSCAALRFMARVLWAKWPPI